MNEGPRRSLIAELADYSVRHPDESILAERISGFVERRADAFLRSCLEGHITGSAFILDPGRSRLLFVHHVKLGKWLQPGGHCEEGETAHEAASREAFEETGLAVMRFQGLGVFDIDIHAIPARPGERDHLHYDIRYLFSAAAGGERVSPESHSLAWLDFAEARRRNPELSIGRPIAKIERLLAAK